MSLSAPPSARSLWSKLLVCAGVTVACHAHAQGTVWNGYQGSSSPVQLNFAASSGTQDPTLHYVGAYLTLPKDTAPQSTAISSANGNSWTLDTGSTGLVITADYLA
jgi:hypothetical protein